MTISMTIDAATCPAARAPRAAASGGLGKLAAVLVLVCAGTTACGLKPETRIDDPDCQYCYRLASGVKYKTYEYYAP